MHFINNILYIPYFIQHINTLYYTKEKTTIHTITLGMYCLPDSVTRPSTIHPAFKKERKHISFFISKNLNPFGFRISLYRFYYFFHFIHISLTSNPIFIFLVNIFVVICNNACGIVLV